MSEEINFDIEDAESHLKNEEIDLRKIDYSDEWKTTTCIDSTFDELETILDNFYQQVISINRYIASINDISLTDPPDIEDDTIEEDDTPIEETLDTDEQDNTDDNVDLEDMGEESDTDIKEDDTESLIDEEEHLEDMSEETDTDIKEDDTESLIDEEEHLENMSEDSDSNYYEKPDETESVIDEEEHLENINHDSDGNNYEKPDEIIDTAFIKTKIALFILDPNDESSAITLNYGTMVTIIDEDFENGLVKVKLDDGREGYIKIETLSLKSDAKVLSNAQVRYGLQNEVTLRFGKSKDSSVIRTITQNDKLEVIGYLNEQNLVKVRMEDGTEGYVSQEYLIINVNNEVQ